MPSASASTPPASATTFGPAPALPPLVAAATSGGGVDWVARGFVSAVKTQSSCGACYAFAVAAAVETWQAIRTGAAAPDSLSEQQMLDCSGNSGCAGGTIPATLAYAAAHGLCAASAYPYVASQTACQQAACAAVVKPSAFVYVDCCADAALEAAVREGAVVVAICTSDAAFQSYGGGVFTGPCCTAVDHSVAVVGFGTDAASGLDFWLLKNSWGSRWGEGGFMRLARGAAYGPSGACGLLQYPARPI